MFRSAPGPHRVPVLPSAPPSRMPQARRPASIAGFAALVTTLAAFGACADPSGPTASAPGGPRSAVGGTALAGDAFGAGYTVTRGAETPAPRAPVLTSDSAVATYTAARALAAQQAQAAAPTAGPSLRIESARDTVPRGVPFTVSLVYRDAKGAVVMPPQPVQVETSMLTVGMPDPRKPPFVFQPVSPGVAQLTINLPGDVAVRARMGSGSGALSAARTFTAALPPITRVAAQPRMQTLAVGATGPLAWTLTDSTGANANGQVAVRVVSLTPAVATVDANAQRVVGLAPGTARIVITPLERVPRPVADTATVVVTGPVVTTLGLAAGSATLAVGASDAVRVTALDAARAPITAPPLVWSSSAPAVARVDAGRVTAVSPGTATITATGVGAAAAVTASVTYTVTAAPTTPSAGATTTSSTGGLPITVRFVGAVPADAQRPLQTTMVRVAQRWSQVIAAGGAPAVVSAPAGACGAWTPAIQETVPGLLLLVRVAPIDGRYNVLAYAGPCILRGTGRALPAVATVTVDPDDVAWLAAAGDGLYSTLLHETGHALGLGTLWGYGSWGLTSALGTDNPLFVGSAAVAAFNALGGRTLGLGGVPIEKAGQVGANGHWRRSTFGAELMVGVVSTAGAMPVSQVTVGALQDLGYTVRTGAADAYALPPGFRANRLPNDAAPSVAGAPAGTHASDVLEVPRHVLDPRTGRIRPLPSAAAR